MEQNDERSNGGIIPTLVIVVYAVVGTLTAVGSIFIIYKKLTKRNPTTRSAIIGEEILSNTTRRQTGQSIAQSRDGKSSKGEGSENDDDVWRVLDFVWNNSLKESQSNEYFIQETIHVGDYHYTNEGERYLDPSCKHCQETMKNRTKARNEQNSCSSSNSSCTILQQSLFRTDDIKFKRSYSCDDSVNLNSYNRTDK